MTTFRDFLATVPAETAASAIHNLAIVWLEKVAPDAKVELFQSLSLVETIAEYYDKPMATDSIERAERCAKLMKKAAAVYEEIENERFFTEQ